MIKEIIILYAEHERTQTGFLEILKIEDGKKESMVSEDAYFYRSKLRSDKDLKELADYWGRKYFNHTVIIAATKF